MSRHFDFYHCRERFLSVCLQALHNGSSSCISSTFAELHGSDHEKRTTMDQALRDVLKDLIVKNSPTDKFLAVISLCIENVTAGTCSASTPFLLLGDILDSLPLGQCDIIFKFVEKNVPTWKSNAFYSAGKNYLLRMCNDLLRRLSKSQNTVFCGRIQLFLARLFPLSEKSGLNLQSQFNLENVTVFNTREQESTLCNKMSEEKEDGMEREEGEMGDDDGQISSLPIDYNLYRKFWSLQDYFRNPAQCYEKVAWKTFQKFSDEVLQVFTSYKLDDLQASKRKQGESRPSTDHVYFAKFLTSEKLMDLQLSDCNFRRHVLLQHLILFQYLKGSVKFKSSQLVLTNEQTLWIDDTTTKVYQLLRETPQDGERFAQAVEHILAREENWIVWKNEGCPSFVRERPSDSKSPRVFRRRPTPEDFFSRSGNKKYLMGSEELTRLWNICPDNMEACKAENREFLPSLEEFFEEAIEQAEPGNMVEEEYKVVNNANYGWRALRLLSRRSPHFFQPTNQQFRSLPEYLGHLVTRLARELPPPPEEIKTEEEPEEDALLKDNDNDSSPASQPLSPSISSLLSSRVGPTWHKLANALALTPTEVSAAEVGASTSAGRASLALSMWRRREGTNSTAEALGTALISAGLAHLWESVMTEVTDAEGEGGGE